MSIRPFFLAIAALLLLPVGSFAQNHNHESAEMALCKEKLESAGIDLVQRGQAIINIVGVSLKKYNDVMYDEKDSECMANVIVTIELPKKRKYTLFHMHYSTAGKWNIKTSVLDGEIILPQWRSFSSDSEWEKVWCDFLNTSMDKYKQELKEQGCEE